MLVVPGQGGLHHKGIDSRDMRLQHRGKKGNHGHETEAQGNDEFRAGVAAGVVDLLDGGPSLELLSLIPGGPAFVLGGDAVRHDE